MGNEPMVPEQQPSDEERSGLAATWREVGDQLQELGAKLSAAFRAAWSSEGRSPEEEEAARTLQDNLRDAADKLERVVKQVASDTEPERQAAAEATREASEQSWAEARVVIVSGLRTLNEQIDGLIERMESQKRASQQAAGQEPPSADTETVQDAVSRDESGSTTPSEDEPAAGS